MNALLRRITTSTLLFLALFTLVIPIPAALAQVVTCQERLAQAEAQYKVGQFEEVIALLPTCLENEGFDEEERQQAYRLLGLSYLGKDLVNDARGTIQKLLELVPDYQADPEQDPPVFTDLVDDVREEMQTEPEPEPEPEPQLEPEPITEQPTREGGRSPLKWLAIGGGALAAAVLGAMLLGGKDNNGNGVQCGPITVNELEPNNFEGQAQVLRNGCPTGADGPVTVLGNLGGNDVEDFYRFTTTEPGLNIFLGDLSANVDIILFRNIEAIGFSTEEGNASEAISVPGLAAGTYLVLVFYVDTDISTSYTLVVDGEIGGSANFSLLYNPDPNVATLAESYRLVGHPGDVDASLSTTFAELAVDNWTAFHEDGADITEYDGSEAFRFRPGRGFWVRSKDAIAFSQTAAPVPLDHNDTYTIALHPGWNIISNPFYVAVDWKAVQEVNYVTQNLWQWQGHYAMTDVFASAERGEAYYFMNATNLEALKIPYPGAASAKAWLERSEAAVLTLSAYRDGEKASSVEVGLAYEASLGFDPYDQFAPPGYFETASLRLVPKPTRPSARRQVLAREFRPQHSDHQLFDLILEAPIGEPITVQVNGLSAFAGYEVYLLDRDRSTLYNLRRQPTLTLLPSVEQSRYFLIIGSSGFVRTMQEELTPSAMHLSNAPNPFNPSTLIAYTVPAPRSGEHVRLAVYNVMGQLVRVLVDASMHQGTYAVTWDGTDASGAPVASGTYLSRLQVGAFSQTNTMLLLK